MNEQIDMENTVVYGTIFTRKLGPALEVGRPEEYVKIKAIWPELWEKYLDFVREFGKNYEINVFFEKPIEDPQTLAETYGSYAGALNLANKAIRGWTSTLKDISSLLSGSDPDKVNKAMAIIGPLLADAQKAENEVDNEPTISEKKDAA